MKIKIEDGFRFEAGDTSSAIQFVKDVGLSVNRDACQVYIPPQEFEADVDTLEGLLHTLEEHGIDHTLCMIVMGVWYLDLF